VTEHLIDKEIMSTNIISYNIIPNHCIHQTIVFIKPLYSSNHCIHQTIVFIKPLYSSINLFLGAQTFNVKNELLSNSF